MADFYTREAGETIDNLVELIQPALMIVMGVAVGILFAAFSAYVWIGAGLLN